MPQPTQATSLDLVLPLIVSKLLSDGVFPSPGLCYLSDEDTELEYPPADQYAVVVAGNSRMQEESQVGGGNAVTMIDQEIIVGVWTRLGVDQAGHSTQILTNRARGILYLVHRVIVSLSQFFPVSTDGNYHSLEGMRLTHQDRIRRVKDSMEWACRRSFFRLDYLADIPSRNPPY